ncbi:uncharacterized protein LOC131886690 [Tigriopus californicus]|uniref:uncharacterized protein LOC131886690 n=1 Tax=Tigriopus californicus TaxID=6832 RepID=UPI0027DA5AB9|nr:uncharacterized protein LOC131886690 [Tigriopus californicus]
MPVVTVLMDKTTIREDLEQLWTLEAMGISDQEDGQLTPAEEKAVEHFEKSTQLKNKRYEVSLPFRERVLKVENNYMQALRCLETLERRWERNQEFASAYKEVMNEYFEKGYAHIVPSEEVRKPKEVFYLPHTAIQLAPTNRDYVRFLWCEEKNQVVRVWRFSSLVFGLACSPYFANAVIQDLANRHGSSHPMASQTLKNDIYVDDVFIFADSSAEALTKLDQVNEMLQEGSFTLTKFYSNSLEPDEQKAKALGVSFHTNTDELVYQVHSVATTWDPNAVETKRTVLSKIAGIFDPLGLVAPKPFFSKYAYIQEEWTQAVKILALQQTQHFPRYIGFETREQMVELHVFCDASKKAYACCIYIRYVLGDNIRVTLLLAKAKVAPTKALSLTRLELMACRIGATLHTKESGMSWTT